MRRAQKSTVPSHVVCPMSHLRASNQTKPPEQTRRTLAALRQAAIRRVPSHSTTSAPILCRPSPHQSLSPSVPLSLHCIPPLPVHPRPNQNYHPRLGTGLGSKREELQASSHDVLPADLLAAIALIAMAALLDLGLDLVFVLRLAYITAAALVSPRALPVAPPSVTDITAR